MLITRRLNAIEKRRGAKVYELPASNKHSASKKNATQENGENLYLSIAFF